MRVIPLTNSYYFAIVDDEDYEEVAKYNWYAHKNGCCIYAESTFGKGSKSMQPLHRFVTGKLVDHINRCGLDCRQNNLRECTQQQNLRNRVMPQGANGSGFRGVFRERERWRAGIRVDGTRINLGLFNTPEEAARAYDAGAIKHHGEFAVLNYA